MVAFSTILRQMQRNFGNFCGVTDVMFRFGAFLAMIPLNR